MDTSVEKINYVVDYLTNYSYYLSVLNTLGLTDAAVLFEMFAMKVSSLWFKQGFRNLNVSKSNYPYVDLISADGKIFVQVSTVQDVPTKIRTTLQNIKEASIGSDQRAKAAQAITSIYFFASDNDSIAKVKDYADVGRIGRLNFRKDENLISFLQLEEAAKSDPVFLDGLYSILHDETESFKEISDELKICLNRSRLLLDDNVDSLIHNEYEIDRSDLIKKIKASRSKFISINGRPGSGKSALCKIMLKAEESVLFARSEKFSEVSSLDEVWHIDIRKLLKYLNGRRIIFYIDALEFIADLSRTKYDLLTELYDLAKKSINCFILTSCRTNDAERFIKLDASFGVSHYEVPELTDEEVGGLCEKYPVIKELAISDSYDGLIRNPFYVNQIVTHISALDSISDINSFRNYIWENIICSNTIYTSNAGSSHSYTAIGTQEIKEAVEYIVFTRAINFSVGVAKDEINSEALKILSANDIVVRNGDKVRLKYDIFEDICFERRIDNLFSQSKGNLSSFFNAVKELGRCAYRRYQIWVENKLFQRDDRDRFLYRILFNRIPGNVPSDLFEQTLIGISKSIFSKKFFDEYSDSILNNRLIEFLDVVNTYAFHPQMCRLQYGNVYTRLTPIGVCRPKLIHAIEKSGIYKKYSRCEEHKDILNSEGIAQDAITDTPELDIRAILKNEKSASASVRNLIIQICSDYSKTPEESFDEDSAKSACCILEYYVEDYVQLIKELERIEKHKGKHFYGFYLRNEVITEYLEPVYHMAEYSRKWIESFWGAMLKERKEDRADALYHLAGIVIENIIKSDVEALPKYMPEQICKVATDIWVEDTDGSDSETEEVINDSGVHSAHEKRAFIQQINRREYDRLDSEGLYGLTREAREYGSYFRKAESNQLFYNLVIYHFNYALEWLINTTNHAAENVKKNNPESVEVITIVDEKGDNREYLANINFWLAGVQENAVPELLGDTIYIFTKILINTLKGKDKTYAANYVEKLAEFIKREIIDKSNNIMMLSVIEAIGMQCEKELPGYAIDLCSSINLLRNDNQKAAYLRPDITKQILNKQILEAVGLPEELLRKYVIGNSRKITLQEYALRSQFLGGHEIRLKVQSILDRLYRTIPNDSEHAEDYLQIRKMDLRDADCQELSVGIISMTPKITGEAKKIVDRAADKPSADGKKEITDLINAISTDDNVKNITTEQLAEKISYLQNLKKNLSVSALADSTLICLIAYAFTRDDLTDEIRAEYCRFWIRGINNLLNYGSFVFETGFSYVLFKQVEKNLPKDLENALKLLCLQLLNMEHSGNGIISGIIEKLKEYLQTNENLADNLFNTIIALSQTNDTDEDEEALKQLLEKYLFCNEKWSKEIEINDNNVSDLCSVC